MPSSQSPETHPTFLPPWEPQVYPSCLQQEQKTSSSLGLSKMTLLEPDELSEHRNVSIPTAGPGVRNPEASQILTDQKRCWPTPKPMYCILSNTPRLQVWIYCSFSKPKKLCCLFPGDTEGLSEPNRNVHYMINH